MPLEVGDVVVDGWMLVMELEMVQQA